MAIFHCRIEKMSAVREAKKESDESKFFLKHVRLMAEKPCYSEAF